MLMVEVSAGMTEVKCSVDSCHYYAEGDRCTASTIKVDHTEYPASRAGRTAETLGRAHPGGKMEVGEIGEGRHRASTSEDTCCRTFILSRRAET